MTRRAPDGRPGYIPQVCPNCGRNTLDKYHFVHVSTERFLCIWQSQGNEIPQADRDYIVETQLKPDGWQSVESVVLR